KVENLLKFLQCQVEQVTDSARDTLEEPDVAHGRSEFDVPHALTPDLGTSDLDTTTFTDDALVAHALVLAAVALPVPCWAEDALAEQPVALRLERSVVDRLGRGYLAVRPVAYLARRRKAGLDEVEVVDVYHCCCAPEGMG